MKKGIILGFILHEYWNMDIGKPHHTMAPQAVICDVHDVVDGVGSYEFMAGGGPFYGFTGSIDNI